MAQGRLVAAHVAHGLVEVPYHLMYARAFAGTTNNVVKTCSIRERGERKLEREIGHMVFGQLQVESFQMLEPHNGVWRVRRRALPKAGRETVKRFGVSQTLDKPG